MTRKLLILVLVSSGVVESVPVSAVFFGLSLPICVWLGVVAVLVGGMLNYVWWRTRNLVRQ